MFQWDDLRYFLVTVRAGNTSRAGRILGVNQSTVSRRLLALEESLGCALFVRTRRGLELKPEGKRLLALAGEMEETMGGIQRGFSDQQDEVAGTVRVTTVEEIASSLIVPHLSAFRKRWPRIQIQLLTGVRLLDLARDEADVSLRMLRPKNGDLVARKVGGFRYAVFAARSYLDSLEASRLDAPESLDWILVDHIIHDSPEAAFMRTVLKGGKPIMRATSTKTVVASVRAGLGVSLLPKPYAYIHPDLVRLPIDTGDLKREIWMVYHKHKRSSPMVNAVVAFLEDAVRQPIVHAL